MAGLLCLLALLLLIVVAAAAATEARAASAFVSSSAGSWVSKQQHEQQQSPLRPPQTAPPQTSFQTPPALAALGGGRFPSFDFDDASEGDEGVLGFSTSSHFDEEGPLAVIDGSLGRPRALSSLLSLAGEAPPPSPPPSQQHLQQQRRRRQRPQQLASASAAATAEAGGPTTAASRWRRRSSSSSSSSRSRSSNRGQGRRQRGSAPAPLHASWRRREEDERDVAAAAAAAAVMSTFLKQPAAVVTATAPATTTPYHRNYQPAPTPTPPPPVTATALQTHQTQTLAHPRFRTEDDDTAALSDAKAAGLLASCEWRFSEVTSVKSVSPDGSVRRVRLEPLPGLPSLFPNHVSARQPGQYLGLRVPVYNPSISLTKPARVFRILAPVASAPERVGPREFVDVLLDGREELVLPSEARGNNNVHGEGALEQALRCLQEQEGGGDVSSCFLEAASGPEAERKAWARLLSEGGLKVGSVLDVSEEVGPGFVSFLHTGPRLALPAMLHEHRDLLILARGTAGMAAVASALDWHKVKKGATHASGCTKGKITVLMEVDTAAHDPLRAARARWQAALGGAVRVVPVLRLPRGLGLMDGGGGGGVEAALFKGPDGGFSPVLGIDPKECAVLVAGMGKRRRARLLSPLLRAGVHPARILDHSLDLARGPGGALPVERCEKGLLLR